jgi:hypothetical protein
LYGDGVTGEDDEFGAIVRIRTAEGARLAGDAWIILNVGGIHGELSKTVPCGALGCTDVWPVLR